MRDETDVETSRRLRDAVLANVSHEFKTPLAAQLASVELLRDRLAELGAPDALALVAPLERGALRLTQLVDNLLESVRIEAGQLGIRRQPVALDEVVEEAAELVSPLLAQRRQRLQIELPYPLPPVLGDPPRLAQVLVNLLANANKYAPEGSTIAVGGALERDGVALWVDDEGPGLPVGAGGAVFERFFRAAGPEPEAGGMGLGLAIVKSIVERHGGSVEVQPRARGTRLAVRLPRGEAA
jgi:signal transduction histidine kinase